MMLSQKKKHTTRNIFFPFSLLFLVVWTNLFIAIVFFFGHKKVFYVRIFRFYCNYVLDACGVVDI